MTGGNSQQVVLSASSQPSHLETRNEIEMEGMRDKIASMEETIELLRKSVRNLRQRLKASKPVVKNDDEESEDESKDDSSSSEE